MDDLVQWLTARLDTDEQIAREATEGPWRNAPTARHHATASGRSEEAVFGSPPDVGAMVVAVTGEAVERRNLVNAEFIAAHDPARVLREIDAKRQLLGQYVSAAKSAEDLGAARDRLSAQGRDTLMTGLELESAIHRRDTLRGVLRLLAAPYSDRPGFREEWSP
ncbi:DUF6221 family protein [Streptomyces europaeiscabiei]|uniref:DUF6221 family protein n=1 Tax=Streptomyces europaeiscabiei TaxID=146819 RepID=UPI0029A5F4F1|nr:DUF6221 family protein [Streptomyces europaeiscabiei]MDX3835625.1 DUF6221 family protein [Streptomyces europaeiscabiei]